MRVAVHRSDPPEGATKVTEDLPTGGVLGG